MARVLRRFSRIGRACRHIGALFIAIAGAAFILFPPVTTTHFWDGAWPPLIWGTVMVVSGAVIGLGLKTRILQVEQYGMLMAAVGVGMLSLNQTMIMFEPPFSPTRLGGTMILWMTVSLCVARYFELAADIRSAKLAEEKVTGA